MMLKDARILVVDDDLDVLMAMRLLFKFLVKEVVTEKNPERIQYHLSKNRFDVVILDMNFKGLVNTGNEGLFWLKRIKEISSKTAIILITAYGDIDLAIKSLKQGANDFIIKPWENEKMIGSIKEVLQKSHQNSTNQKALKGEKIIGESERMKDVFMKVKKVAPTDANILILGENGTGKDLIARAIHDNSLRSNKPFVKVDVGALSPTLFESELFGYKKGAFTDAKEDRKGRFETADGGTLFLDEIGNIKLDQQARLLTVLQNRQVTPLGSNESISIDIRLICATNLELGDLADENKFRKDLIYRINTLDITVPPLRDRGADLVLLTKYFVSIYAEKYLKDFFELDPGFIKKLKEHPFLGNVRELQYVLERAVIMSNGSVLMEKDLVFSPIESKRNLSTSNDTRLETVEKNTILKVLEKNKGNISKSAKELGITRTALYRRLDKHDLQ